MKKYLIALAGLASALFLASCSKEVQSPANDVISGTEITITINSDSAKSTNDGKSFSWTEGDEISVFMCEHGATMGDGDWTNIKFTCKDCDKGTFSAVLEDGFDESLSYDFYAFYPYYKELTNPKSASMNVAYNAAIEGTEGVIPGKYAPLWGAAEDVEIADLSMQMHHIATFFKLSIKAEEAITVASITTESPSGVYCGTQVKVDATNNGAQTSGGYTATTVTASVKNGALAAGETGIFLVPARSFSLAKDQKVTFTVYTTESSMTIDVVAPEGGYNFAPGKVNSVARTYVPDEEETLPVVNNDEKAYYCGFETYESDKFIATSTYNNSTEDTVGPETAPWIIYYGTPSTSSCLDGAQSLQNRWYKTSEDNLGYSRTGFKVSTLKYVKFYAAQTNKLKIDLLYKADGVSSWTLAKTYEPGTSAAYYDYTFETPLKNAQLKWQIVLPSAKPSSTSNIRIDKVYLAAAVPASTTTLTMSDVTCAESTVESLTFAWTAVPGALGYEVFEGGSSKGTVAGTEFILTELSGNTEYTVSVKAIGNGIDVLTSDAVSCTAKTEMGSETITPMNYVLDTSAGNTKGKSSAYAASEDITVDGITWNACGNTTMNPWRIGGKELNKVDRLVYTKTALPFAYSKIGLTIGTHQTNLIVNSCKLVYSANSDFSSAKEISFDFKAGSTTTITCDDVFPANSYYKFVFNVSNSSTNYYFQFSKVEFFVPAE